MTGIWLDPGKQHISACVNLDSVLSLIFEYGRGRVALLVLLFESVTDSNGNSFGLSVRVKISTPPCKLVGLLSSMYVYMGLRESANN